MPAKYPKTRAGKPTGFTAIELMIVVSIIGILASTAVPAFMKFIRETKTSTASNPPEQSSAGINWETHSADLFVSDIQKGSFAGISFDATSLSVAASGGDELRYSATMDKGRGSFALVDTDTSVETELTSSVDQVGSIKFEFLNPDRLLPNPVIALGEPGARMSLDLAMSKGALFDWGFTAGLDDRGDLQITDRRGSFLDSDLMVAGDSIVGIRSLSVPIDLIADTPIFPTYEIGLSASEGVDPLPEPTTFVLTAIGLFSLGRLRRRRRPRVS